MATAISEASSRDPFGNLDTGRTQFELKSDLEYHQELSQATSMDRMVTDHMSLPRSEERRPKRTIIIEKDNGSCGFTIQSYALHYKKDDEIEIITYVDYVEYGGPAHEAGMKEGDVILSINGHDMEKSDHKTLVHFIQNCGDRMRMVVQFENCVHKVELHMRYIHLQRCLQEKMLELERLCYQEKSLLAAWRAQGYRIPQHLVITRPVSFHHRHLPHQHRTQKSLCAPPQARRPTSAMPAGIILPPPQYRVQPSADHKAEQAVWQAPPSSSTSSPNYVNNYQHHSEKSLYAPEDDCYQSPFSERKSAKNCSQTFSRQWTRHKPRSWDNLLSTKSFGGYGFGYGFIDKTCSKGAESDDKYTADSPRHHIGKENSGHVDGDDDDEDKWSEKSSTMPRSKFRPNRFPADSLKSPLNTSSCFSCECLSINAQPLNGCLFVKPKSSESLLAPKSLHPTASETSLAPAETHPPKRKSKASSLADCLGGSHHSPPSNDEMTHL